MQCTKNPREREKVLSNTVRLTVCWARDIVVNSKKSRLISLFAKRDHALLDTEEVHLKVGDTVV